MPLSRGADGSITTQFTMTTIEELGLLKMDFLGLRTLTVLRDAVKLVKQSTGKEINLDQIDFDDKKVLASIGTGKTDGVFQLESAGMKNFMKELKPTEPGRYYCREFPSTVRDRWTLFRNILRERAILERLPICVHSLSRFCHRPTAVLFIRSR